jgi:hypothetical protein
LRRARFDSVTKPTQLSDHFSCTLLLGGFANLWASFFVADAAVQYLPDQSNPSSPCTSKSVLRIEQEPSPAQTRAAGSSSPAGWLKPLLIRLFFPLHSYSRCAARVSSPSSSVHRSVIWSHRGDNPFQRLQTEFSPQIFSGNVRPPGSPSLVPKTGRSGWHPGSPQARRGE